MGVVALWLTLMACGGDDDGSGAIDGGPDAVDAGAGGGDAAKSGRACSTGLPAEHPTVLASPALECPSRVCLHVEGDEAERCTARCDDASDCIAAAETSCDGEHVCVAPMDDGPFACETVCVCAEAVPEGGFPVTCAR
jgi:hypothetical protein